MGVRSISISLILGVWILDFRAGMEWNWMYPSFAHSGVTNEEGSSSFAAHFRRRTLMHQSLCSCHITNQICWLSPSHIVISTGRVVWIIKTRPEFVDVNVHLSPEWYGCFAGAVGAGAPEFYFLETCYLGEIVMIPSFTKQNQCSRLNLFAHFKIRKSGSPE